MIRSTYYLLFVLLLAACSAVDLPAQPARTPTPMRILSLGDSYTIGQSVDPMERWPVQLAARLRAEGFAVEDPQIIARTGWRTDDLMAAMERENPLGPYDLVTLLIGVNNQFQGRDLESYRADLRLLLDRAVEQAGGQQNRVLVLSIPDWGVTPFAAGRNASVIAAEIDAFNAVKLEEAEAAGVLYVEITAISRRAGGEEGWLADDGLHPSGKMYAAWVEAALPSVLDALR